MILYLLLLVVLLLFFFIFNSSSNCAKFVQIEFEFLILYIFRDIFFLSVRISNLLSRYFYIDSSSYSIYIRCFFYCFYFIMCWHLGIKVLLIYIAKIISKDRNMFFSFMITFSNDDFRVKDDSMISKIR